MQLHFSWTVLAAIIWTILLYSSAKETISKRIKLVEDLKENSIGAAERIDKKWNLENKVEAFPNVGPNVETKSPSDITERRIIRENGVASSKAVGNTVAKRHVREQSLSQETPISRKYDRNKGNLGAGKYQSKDNDGNGLFQHRSKPLLKGSVLITHHSDRKMSSLEKHASNIPGEATTESVSLEGDDTVSNRALSKGSVSSKTGEASNLIGTSSTSVSLINGLNTSSGAKPRSLNSSLETRTSVYRNSTDLKVSQVNRSEGKIRFVGYSRLNEDSSEKNEALHKAISGDEASGEHQDASSPEIQEPLSFFVPDNDAENIGKREEGERMFIGKIQYMLGETSVAREKQRDKNVPRTIRENTFVDGILASNEIFEPEIKEKMESIQHREDPTVSTELGSIETANKQVGKRLPKMKQETHQGLKGSVTFTFSPTSINFLAKEDNGIFESGSLGNASPGSKISGGASSEQSGQSVKSSTHSARTKLDFLTEDTNDQGCKHITKLPSVRPSSYPRDFSVSQDLKKSGSLSPEGTESYQQQRFTQEFQKMNKPGDGNDQHKSSSVSSRNNKASVTKNDRVRVIGGSKNEIKISEEFKLEKAKSDMHIGSLKSQVSDNNKRASRKEKLADNPSSQDIKMKVREKVVKTKLTGLQRDRRAHKTFIGPNFVGDMNQGFYQTPEEQVQVQEPKKYRGKLTFDTRPMEINGFPGRKDEASSFQQTLVNSEAYASLWPGVKRKNVLSDSSSGPSIDVTGKMEFSSRDTQGSGEIKIISDDGARKIFFFEEPSKVEPRSMQFLQAASSKDRTSGNAENKKHFIRKIFQPVRTDTSLSIGLPPARVSSRDFESVKNDAQVHESDRSMTRNLESLESKSLLDGEVFDDVLKSEPQEKITWNSRKKSDVARGNASESRSTNTNVNRIEPTVGELVRSAGENPQALSTEPEIARAHIDDTSHDKTIQRHNRRRATGIVTVRENYSSEARSNESNETSIINRSNLRDRIGSNNKNVSPGEQRNTKNRNNDRILSDVPCDRCKILKHIATEGKGQSQTFHFSNQKNWHEKEFNSPSHENRNKEKAAQSVTEMNSLFPPGTTREKGVPVDPTVTDGHANSLVDTATNLEVTVRPKVHFEERLQWKNVGTLVRGQGEMMGRSAGNNINSPRELTSALEPRATSIAKLQGTDERNTTVNKTFYRSSESSLSSNRDVETHVARSSGGAPPESNDKKIEIRPSRSNEALADERRKEFSDNGDDVSRDQLNFRPPSTYPTENVSGNVESVKTLVYRDTTTTSMSSMKIDSSIGLIDRASYRLAFTGKKEYTSDTQSYSSPLGNSRAVGKLYNVRKKRIDRGFMKENSHSDFTTAKATPREYVDYKNSMTTQKNEIDTTKSTKTNDDSHKTEETLAKILHIPVADLKISNFSSSDNSDSTAPNFTTYPPSPNPSPIMNESQLSQDPPNMKQKSQLLSEQPVGKPSESIDTGILNQTVYDNSTRVTTTLNQWPVKHSAVVEGDLVLGGLMMVHEREDSVTCGPVMPQGGVQALEAMLYTLDWLNKRDLVPGVKIGAHILDDCDKDTYGLEMAVDFIKETTARVYLLQMLPEANAVYTNCVKSVQVLSAVPNSTSLNSISSGVHFCMGAFST